MVTPACYGTQDINNSEGPPHHSRDTARARPVNDSPSSAASFVLLVAKCDLNSLGFVPNRFASQSDEKRNANIIVISELSCGFEIWH